MFFKEIEVSSYIIELRLQISPERCEDFVSDGVSISV